jgi:hypothetical protein
MIATIEELLNKMGILLGTLVLFRKHKRPARALQKLFFRGP